MFFVKDELIELEDRKKYFVLETALFNNEVFYQVQEVNPEGTNVIGNKKIITAINENSDIFIEDINDEVKLLELKKIFAS